MKIRIKPVLTAVFVTVVAASLLSVLRGAEYLFLVAGAALIHEAGHIITAKLLKVPSRGGSPTFLGMSLKYDFSAVSFASEAAVSAAGGVFNLAACLIAYLIFGTGGIYPVFFIFSNLSLALFNLLPVSPLDGSGVILAVLSMIMSAETAYRVTKYLSAVVGAAFFVFCIYVQLKVGTNLSLMFISVVLLFNALRGIKGRHSDNCL